ncbi:MAG: hypothetical protein PHS44_03735 [Candidatus Dojkabacteria bacterium]|nr:hypothetical protein [Candidatus Dojkabacteria bacterium]
MMSAEKENVFQNLLTKEQIKTMKDAYLSNDPLQQKLTKANVIGILEEYAERKRSDPKAVIDFLEFIAANILNLSGNRPVFPEQLYDNAYCAAMDPNR